MSDRNNTVVIETAEQFWHVKTRRDFLRVLGIGGAAVLLPSVFGACSDDDDPTGNGGTTTGAVTLDLSSETGILNYAFALEQLEAGFYEGVVASTAFSGMSGELQEVFTDLRNHEVAHREFFRQALGNGRIGNLALNATTLNSVLGAGTAAILKTAETFEDLGVAAYNGAGKYLTTPANLLLAGKIVSVEARHAAAIRDIRSAAPYNVAGGNARFAGEDVVNGQGLDVVLEPGTVRARVIASTFVQTTINVSGTLPVARQTGTSTTEFGPPNPTP
jgi:hypothetical protein